MDAHLVLVSTGAIMMEEVGLRDEGRAAVDSRCCDSSLQCAVVLCYAVNSEVESHTDSGKEQPETTIVRVQRSGNGRGRARSERAGDSGGESVALLEVRRGVPEDYRGAANAQGALARPEGLEPSPPGLEDRNPLITGLSRQ